MTEIQFEELGKEERTLLLRAFNYDVDEKGFVLDPAGNRLRSKERPDELLSVMDAALVPGSLNVIDGSPDAISEYIREKKIF